MPKIILIGKCLLKLQLKTSGIFFETQCSTIPHSATVTTRWFRIHHSLRVLTSLKCRLQRISRSWSLKRWSRGQSETSSPISTSSEQCSVCFIGNMTESPR